jgi:two-component system, NarL family, response regulator DegU
LRHPRDPGNIAGAISIASETSPVSLTHRQREVVTLLCEGLNTKQIARRLGVVPAVVSNHLLAVRRANGLKNTAQIGMAAERAGIVRLDEGEG